MTTLLLILLGLYIAYLMVNFETTNPFTVLKHASRDVGVVAGATPRTIRTAKNAASVLSKESKIEMLEAGTAADMSFKEGRKKGQQWAKETYSEYETELAERSAKANAKLAELTK